MADDPTPATGTAPEPAKEPEKTPDPPKEPEVPAGAENPDAVKRALDAERKAAKEAGKRADAAEAKVRAFEDKDKTEQQRLEDRAAAAEKEKSTAEAKLLRFEVAAEKGLPSKWATRLSGSSKEELEADADELLTELKEAPPRQGFDGGARQPAPTGADMNQLLRQAAGRT